MPKFSTVRLMNENEYLHRIKDSTGPQWDAVFRPDIVSTTRNCQMLTMVQTLHTGPALVVSHGRSPCAGVLPKHQCSRARGVPRTSSESTRHAASSAQRMAQSSERDHQHQLCAVYHRKIPLQCGVAWIVFGLCTTRVAPATTRLVWFPRVHHTV